MKEVYQIPSTVQADPNEVYRPESVKHDVMLRSRPFIIEFPNSGNTTANIYNSSLITPLESKKNFIEDSPPVSKSGRQRGCWDELRDTMNSNDIKQRHAEQEAKFVNMAQDLFKIIDIGV